MNVEGDKVYSGRSTNSSDQIMTINDAKVFEGRSTNSSDQIATISGGRLNDSQLSSVIYLIAQRNNLL